VLKLHTAQEEESYLSLADETGDPGPMPPGGAVRESRGRHQGGSPAGSAATGTAGR
jgi:hypothetical protein